MLRYTAESCSNGHLLPESTGLNSMEMSFFIWALESMSFFSSSVTPESCSEASAARASAVKPFFYVYLRFNWYPSNYDSEASDSSHAISRCFKQVQFCNRRLRWWTATGKLCRAAQLSCSAPRCRSTSTLAAPAWMAPRDLEVPSRSRVKMSACEKHRYNQGAL